MSCQELLGVSTVNEFLLNLSAKTKLEITSEEFKEHLDSEDVLSNLRSEFLFPDVHEFPGVNREDAKGKECVYLCGNSLGLQPKSTKIEINKILSNWSMKGNHCHEHGILPAAHCDNYVTEDMAKLVGAHNDEVVVMNGLSVNLHLLLVSFYQPTKKRHKILLEEKAFPSDHYIVESQIKQRGFDPEASMVFLNRKKGCECWDMDEIISEINAAGESISVVLLPGVQYYNGQVFDMERITKAAHSVGAMVGFDLAHAVGNIELSLHDWEVDFAAWCTYKYLNSGPGCIAAAYLHNKHKHNNFPRFSGWWSHEHSSRFEMSNKMQLTPGVKGYRVSNPPPVLVACVRASLDVFNKTSMKELRKKSILLTGYLRFLIEHRFKRRASSSCWIEIITPPDQGCQLTLKFSHPVKQVYESLEREGVCCDIREPDSIRVAPVPLYNNFDDAHRFVRILHSIL